MTFSVKDWQDSPSTATPVSAAGLEDLETRLSGYTDSSITAIPNDPVAATAGRRTLGFTGNSAAPGASLPAQSLGTAVPTTGAHVRGELVWNTAPDPGGNVGWVCTTAGTPGTWKPFGVIGV